MENFNWTFMWTVVISGILIVFFVLIALSLFIALLGKINVAISNFIENKKSSKNTKTDTDERLKQLKQSNMEKQNKSQLAQSQTDGIDNQVVAAISGALYSVLGSNFKIKSIKKRKDKKRGRNIWSAAAVAENTKPF